MTRSLSRAQRRKAYLEAATEMADDLENWYDAHPSATFDELEQRARQLRRTYMGQTLAILINGRDTGFQVQAPLCTQCGAEMEFIDYKEWTVHGLEGDTTLERAYYVCPNCAGQTLFPPGPQAPTAS
jgi:DNA-directed RNA polymerase subunit RPC12/RpoP